MFYKKFKVDENNCIDVSTINIITNDKTIAFTQLMTDGQIIEKKPPREEEPRIFNLPIPEENLGFSNRLTINQIKIANPNYYSLSLYALKENNYHLITRETFINANKGLLYELNYIHNMPQDTYLSSTEPDHEKDNVKVLRKSKHHSNSPHNQ